MSKMTARTFDHNEDRLRERVPATPDTSAFDFVKFILLVSAGETEYISNLISAPDKDHLWIRGGTEQQANTKQQGVMR